MGARVTADLTGAHLVGARFEDADCSADEKNQSMGLMRATFKSADLGRADFARANLARADLRFAKLPGANLAGLRCARRTQAAPICAALFFRAPTPRVWTSILRASTGQASPFWRRRSTSIAPTASNRAALALGSAPQGWTGETSWATASTSPRGWRVSLGDEGRR
jgi:uncharacterized protein YjbI with pentapeptide repeats